MPNDPRLCQHLNYQVDTSVNRTTLPDGKLAAVHLTVTMTCRDCGEPFWFPGMPTGLSYREPTTGTDGFQATLPAVQANRRPVVHAALVATTIRNGDMLKGHRR